MKTMKSLKLSLMLLATSAAITVTSCSTLQKEFSQPAGTSDVPPVTAQLQAAAPVVAGVIPPPWGSLIAALMNLAGTGAAAFATFHARRAAVASATATAMAAPTTAATKN